MTASSNEPITSEARGSNHDVLMDVRDTNVAFKMDRGTSQVLKDVSLSINRDEILGVVGESGSGKSMFASALLDAIVDPGILDGEITYYPENGDPINVLEFTDDELNSFRWETVSMVFQGAQSSFNPTMNIRGHFKETLRHHNYEVESGMQHARELLEELYLPPERVLNSYPHELSGGMQQRALIALSLVLEPKVLVMDEPTAALDLLMQRSILSLLQNLQEQYDLSVVFITHDLPLVAGLADRLAVMYAFEFVEIGEAEQLINAPAHPYTRSLLNAVPNLNAPLGEMHPIKGSSPDPVNIPSGCSYHPRCPLADESCRSEDPSQESVDSDHTVACFNWEQSEAEIPLNVESDYERVQIQGHQSEDSVVRLTDVNVHFSTQDSGLLSTIFGDSDTVHAVDDVSLDIYENDVVALVGESGCGKTTLGKTVVAGQRPTNGTVSYSDQDVWEAKDGVGDQTIPYGDIRRSLQIIHQDPGSSLNPNRTVQSTLTVPLRRTNNDLTAMEREERIHSMLEYVGMTPPEDYAARYPHQLSGGEKQRVTLIRAILMNPDVILADEAVSALDVSLRVEMMDLMLELQDVFGTSFVFVSHDLSNARYLAGNVGGRIAVMYLGKIVEIGPAEQIIEDPQHPYTQVLKWATADLEIDDRVEKPPMRSIDIPDPVDPPSGCRFHTRCPEAREVCKREVPELEGAEGAHKTACFRTHDDGHQYWESEPIEDDESNSLDADQTGSLSD